jgi:L-rhamnose mutarotase
MKRIAFKMKLKEGFIKDYEERHNNIWIELEKLLKEQGIHEYSIFFDDETHTLFGFQKVEGNAGSQDLAENKIVKKWWEFMADIMYVNKDNSPVTIPLKEVFYLE